MALIIQIIPILLAILSSVIIWLSSDNKLAPQMRFNHKEIIIDHNVVIK